MSFHSFKPNSVNGVGLPRSEDSNKRPPGTPGTPGSRDLEAALRRLSLRRDNYLSEKRFFEEERERKLAYLAKEEEKGGGGSSGGPGTPTESLFSLCSHPSLGSIWSGYAYTARSYLPEKLQIVKPLEGDYSQNKSQKLQNQHQCVIFHKHRIYLSASQGLKTLKSSSSLLELSSQQSPQPHLRAPLALIADLLEVLEQQGSTLNLQHSFYFRHTQPRCWFEV